MDEVAQRVQALAAKARGSAPKSAPAKPTHKPTIGRSPVCVVLWYAAMSNLGLGGDTEDEDRIKAVAVAAAGQGGFWWANAGRSSKTKSESQRKAEKAKKLKETLADDAIRGGEEFSFGGMNFTVWPAAGRFKAKERKGEGTSARFDNYLAKVAKTCGKTEAEILAHASVLVRGRERFDGFGTAGFWGKVRDLCKVGQPLSVEKFLTLTPEDVRGRG